MPVSSVNSLMFFCRTSPRGPLARITSSLVPAYFFHCGSARAGNPDSPNAPAAAVPARTVRREIGTCFIVSLPEASFLGRIVAFSLPTINASLLGEHSTRDCPGRLRRQAVEADLQHQSGRGGALERICVNSGQAGDVPRVRP